MRATEPQPPMPTVKRAVYVILLVAAIIIGLVMARRGLMNGETFTQITINLMVTLLIVSFVELLPELGRWIAEKSERARFIRFFGSAAVKDDVRLVFAHRELPSRLGDPWKIHCPIPQVEGVKPVPEGVNVWLPAQDINAAVPLANLLAKFAHRDVKFTFDKHLDTDDFDFCAISIGLGFNCFTRRLANWCDPDLFTIKWGSSIKASFVQKTDYFMLGDGRIPSPPEGKDDALIARIVPVTGPGKPKRICFVCAGRTAAGTAVAGYFLAKNWGKISHLYQTAQPKKELQRDSLAVVIRHKADESGTMDLLEAVIGKDETGIDLCFWAQVPGV
jgi:hypothetical protein